MPDTAKEDGLEARYLRVRNLARFQHYSKRQPPWIKLYRTVITGENGQLDDFLKLEEVEQWQLVRLWVLASQCDDGLLAFDERWVRLAIRSEKKVVIEKFIRAGFLEVLSAEEADAIRAESASAVLAKPPLDASATLANGSQKEADVALQSKQRSTEVLETTVNPNRPVEDDSGEGQLLELASLRAASRLFEAIPVDDRDEGTERVVIGYARILDAETLDGIRLQLEKKLAEDGLFKGAGAYVNGALRKAARITTVPAEWFAQPPVSSDLILSFKTEPIEA